MLKNKFLVGISVATLVLAPALMGALPAHADYDYIVTATDTIPVFQNAAAVAKSNGLAVLNVGLPYVAAFLVAIVILALVMLPVKKLWRSIFGGH